MNALAPHHQFMVQESHPDPSSALDVETLWDNFHQQLRGFILRKVNSEEVCEELLQTAFFRAQEALTAGAEPRQPRAWLYQIVKNLLVDVYRNQEKHGRLTTTLQHQEALRVDEREPLSLGQEAADVIARALPDFVQALPTPYRQALELTDLQGLSQAEAAKKIGVSATCMKTRVRRGRQQLLEALKRCCTFEVDGRGRPIACVRRNQTPTCGCD